MRRTLGFQQQCYADDGMWMDTQAQQQSYAFHEESWGSYNNHHKQFPGMHMKPGSFALESELSMSKQHGKFGGNFGMFQESKPVGHGYGFVHGGGKKHPFGGLNASHHQFSNGGAKFDSGAHHGYFSEESEYQAYSEEEHHAEAMVKAQDEMRYDRHNWRGGDGFYAIPNDMNKNMKWKPHGGHKVEWTPKGV